MIWWKYFNPNESQSLVNLHQEGGSFSMLPQNGRSLLIDSGAFSAWNSNRIINIGEYTDWVLENLDKADFFVNLDVIPGSPGKIPSSVEVEDSAKKGWRNYHYMLRRGVPVEKLIHVFHMGEEMKWLNRMLDFPYIGLSPANDRNTRDKKLWLERCMDVVTDKDGMPLNKWHGFAVTSPSMMKEFPWYSVDSASWCLSAVWGKILLYTEERDNIYSVHVTRPGELAENLDLVNSRMEMNGITCIEELTGHSPVFRMKWNVMEVQRFADNLPKWPWAYRKRKCLLF